MALQTSNSEPMVHQVKDTNSQGDFQGTRWIELVSDWTSVGPKWVFVAKLSLPPFVVIFSSMGQIRSTNILKTNNPGLERERGGGLSS